MGVPEIQLYIDRARDELRATQINLSEALYGVAVTRAYYAMFYAANALLVSRGISRSKHSGVIAAFGEHFVKTGLIETRYAKMLGSAFDSRLDSDYDVTFAADQALAEELLRDAQSFVDQVEQFLHRAGVL
jgi:uncharacterized protein (UPF0332 family)